MSCEPSKVQLLLKAIEAGQAPEGGISRFSDDEMLAALGFRSLLENGDSSAMQDAAELRFSGRGDVAPDFEDLVSPGRLRLREWASFNASLSVSDPPSSSLGSEGTRSAAIEHTLASELLRRDLNRQGGSSSRQPEVPADSADSSDAREVLGAPSEGADHDAQGFRTSIADVLASAPNPAARRITADAIEISRRFTARPTFPRDDGKK